MPNWLIDKVNNMRAAEEYIKIKIVDFSKLGSGKIPNLLIEDNKDSNKDFIPNDNSITIED